MFHATPGRRLANAIQTPFNAGLLIIAVAFVGVGIWAAVTPLASAAIASGKVSPSGSKRVVQHLEGGIVQRLFVAEGDVVAEGQPLAILEKTQAMARFHASRRKLARLSATRDRLAAEALGAAELRISSEAPAAEIDASFAQFAANERQTFEINKALRASEAEAYSKQIAQVEAEIGSLGAQMSGAEKQRAIVLEELEAKRGLLESGLIRKPEVLAMERRLVELDTGLDAVSATVARARQKISEIEVARLSAETRFKRKVAEELAGVNAEIVQVEEALSASDDVLARTEIRSPIAGKVLELGVRTIGGVVRPGEEIFTIVPLEEDLIIDARLAQTDIDAVEIGMAALVQVNAFAARNQKPLEGALAHVGADVVQDTQTGEFFYPIKVKITRESELSQKEAPESRVRLVPGMPADVFVLTGTKTVAQYLLEPITANFDRAFRED